MALASKRSSIPNPRLEQIQLSAVEHAQGATAVVDFQAEVKLRDGKVVDLCNREAQTQIIASSEGSVTEYDLWPLRVMRSLLQLGLPLMRPRGARKESAIGQDASR